MLVFLGGMILIGILAKYNILLGKKIQSEVSLDNQAFPIARTEIVNDADIDKNQLNHTEPKIGIAPPIISAKAYLIMDVKTDTVLFSNNSDMQLPPASLTKIMTAIVAMEEYSLSKSVVVPERCVGLDGTSIGFKTNEVFTLEDMLYGLLVKSGADAACAIANISSEADFLAKMNEKAKEIGLQNTVFQNEIGFDAKNNQLTSVEDIRKLSLYALKISTFRKIVGTKNAVIKNLNTVQKYSFQNTNDLLFTIPGTVGIKTGLTEKAGQCLSYLYQNRDREILIIILGSQDRFQDTKALLEWANAELDFRNKEL